MEAETILVSRPTYSNSKFQETFVVEEKDKRISHRFQRWRARNLTCTSYRCWKILTRVFPVISWLPKYEKKFIVGDLIAGWTVGIIRIPQGMAYALLAGVQPVYGLYSCFFPVLLWFLFSTSRHTSVGTMAVVCLMLQNLVAFHVPDQTFTYDNRSQLLVNGREIDSTTLPSQFADEAGSLLSNSTAAYVDYLTQQQEDARIQVACSATLLVGITQLLMSLLRLGFLTTLLSDPVIQGFTTGAAFHVMMSQVKYLFGLDGVVPRHTGPFALFKALYDVIAKLGQSNPADVVISSLAISTLLTTKHLNQKYARQLRNIPIPVELLVVVVATLTSYFARLHLPPYNVNTVKTIPTGFPTWTRPQYTNLWGEMVGDCLIMAFISVAISLSLTKIYADKHGYDFDANQEIFALGVCNSLPSFLSSFAIAASLSRTAIQESTGGKTQLVAVISSVLMLIVLLWLAPLFQPVPKSALACIIVVALKSLFMQFDKLKALWSVSRLDFAIWLTTCTSVVCLGVDIGLACGVGVAVGVLVYRVQHPRHALLGRVAHTDLYCDVTKYRDASELHGIKIFHYADSVSFVNKDAFRVSLYRSIGCNPSTILSKLEKRKAKLPASESAKNLLHRSQPNTSGLAAGKLETRKRSGLDGAGGAGELGFSILILDATMWSFVDSTAGREIVQIVDRFSQLDITVLIASPSAHVMSTLDGCGMTSHVTHERIFVTLHDAVVFGEKVMQQRHHVVDDSDDERDPYCERPGYPGFDSLAL